MRDLERDGMEGGGNGADQQGSRRYGCWPCRWFGGGRMLQKALDSGRDGVAAGDEG